MIQKSIITILTILIILNCNFTIEKKKNEITNITWNGFQPIKEEQAIGTLIINKINLKQDFYERTSKKNNVEQNITLLKESDYPDKENGIVIIAAHSGFGEVAFFKNLDQLKEQDTIIINYQNKDYLYIVDDIFIEEKNGKIHFSTKKDKKYLILTTCMPHHQGKQLIIIATEKEPH